MNIEYDVTIRAKLTLMLSSDELDLLNVVLQAAIKYCDHENIVLNPVAPARASLMQDAKQTALKILNYLPEPPDVYDLDVPFKLGDS